ncbi:MAG: hypothetical protein M5R38_07800 [Candidatus Methylomirabilis sp.]|nr:hypothetical protein [Candidatus Methylomirabilis sp.]
MRIRGQPVRVPALPPQTAWALLGLLHAGVVRHPSVEKGIDYLLRTQGADGGWEEREFTGTGFPRVFLPAVSSLSTLLPTLGPFPVSYPAPEGRFRPQ